MFLEKIDADHLAVDMPAGRTGISLIGQSDAASGLRRMVSLSAATDAPLMLTGPSGVGKRDVAATIHGRSDSASGGFLFLHCATMDAHFNSVERFAPARGGTVFLDEIGDISANMHNCIYQLIEGRSSRIICASTKSPACLVNENLVPADLCTAISTLTLPVPPLSKRRKDIPLLIEAHIQQLPKHKRFTLNPAAQQLTSEYEWPGNFNEMQDIVGRLGKQYGGSRITAHHLIAMMRSSGVTLSQPLEQSAKDAETELKPGFDLTQHLAEEEIKHIEQALLQTGGIVQQAAEITGIKRTTFLAKMRKYGISKLMSNEPSEPVRAKSYSKASVIRDPKG